MSKTSEPIDREQHLAWFAKAVDDPDRRFLIGVVEGEKVGMVRLDAADGWLVNINVAPEHRGKRYGKDLLNAALASVDGPFIAEILTQNEASLRLFRGCGFTVERTGDLVRMIRA